MKWLFGILLALVLVTFGVVGTMRAGFWTPGYDEVKAKYTNDASQFANIDGMSVHYRDEGTGPVLVLLHGNIGSLHQWDGWVDHLKSDYRIVRFDFSPYGLTGPDPTKTYTLERNLYLMEELVDRLGLDAFHLGGTSFGASVALAYTDRHPDRVLSLLLSTLPAVTPPERSVSSRQQLNVIVHRLVIQEYYSKLYWRISLESIFGEPQKVTSKLVDRYHDLNTWTGQIDRSNAFISALVTEPVFDLPDILSRLDKPTLLQWPGRSPVLPGDLVDDVAALFLKAPLTVLEYPQAGHKLMIELPKETAEDAKRFLEKERPSGAALDRAPNQ